MRRQVLISALVVIGALTAGAPAGVALSAPARASAQNHVHSLLISPTNPNVLYLGAHYRLYRSTDGGVHWKPLFGQMMLSMALDTSRPGTIYGVSLQGGFLSSTDWGARWKAPRSRPAKGSVSGVVYDTAGKTILAYGSGIYRSTDGGGHWTHTLAGQSVSSVAAGRKAQYAASDSGLYASEDHGKRWRAVASVGTQPILQVAASGDTAYAVGAIALLRSTNDGRSWQELTRSPQGVQFVGVAPSDPRVVFAEVGGQGFYVSQNGGGSWKRANSGIHDSNFTSSVVRVAPSSPKIAYTGAWGLHFYATRDGGRHWKETASLIK